MRFLPQRWNDTLSVLIIAGVPLLWVFGGLPEMALGATIAGWTLCLQFYFRKRDDSGEVPHG